MLEKVVKEFEKGLDNLADEGFERKAIINARVNQSVFRKKLLNRYGKCCICGINITDCLIASHIRPWSECEDAKDKLNEDNGLLLCPNHDKLFDNGLISFDDNGKIVISSKLDSENQKLLGVSSDNLIEYHGNTKEYMKYHRKKYFPEIG